MVSTVSFYCITHHLIVENLFCDTCTGLMPGVHNNTQISIYFLRPLCYLLKFQLKRFNFL